MSDITWIKIRVDIFDDNKIKMIRQMPEGDQLFLVWINLLTQAGKTNANGYIYITQDMPVDDVTLSCVTGVTLPIVRLALSTFEKMEMIEIDEKGHICIINWSKHQNVDALDKIRESNKLRQQKFRNKQKQLPENNVTVTLRNKTDKNRIDKNRKESVTHPLQKFVAENFPNVSRLKTQLTEKNCITLLDKYPKQIIKEVLESMDNHKPLTKKYVDVYRTCNSWCQIRIDKNGNGNQSSGKNQNTGAVDPALITTV